MVDPKSVPDEEIDTLIDPDLRQEIGNPCPVSFAATVVYTPLMIVGLIICAFFTKTIPPPGDMSRIGTDIGIGFAVAIGVVFVTFVLARMIPALQSMEVAFRRTLGPMSAGEIIRIALLSGIAEELLFRGALQPWAGLIITSVLFGILHFVPDKAWFPWTIFATGFGFLAGWLFESRGSLVAPITAHVIVNLANLALIVSGRRLPITATR